MATQPRAGLAAILEGQGLSFHARDGYWREDACYRFESAEIDQIEAATADIYAMCVATLRRAIRDGRLGELQVPPRYWDAIAESLRREDFSLYGRLDLAYDGKSPPKLLEFNADTPTSLLESAVCQWFWLQDCFPGCDQFNSLHERLIARWRELPEDAAVHLTCLAESEEDWVCVAYLMDTIGQAGRIARQLPVEEIGWDPAKSRFVDELGQPIRYLFKLYPWEWMMREEFGPHVVDAGTRMIEPLWKAPLSCKGLLVLLWEEYPGHPNLLPAYFTPDSLREYAKKPLYSREGANVELISNGRCIQKISGPYGADGYVYQALHQLPNFEGNFPVIGSWLVDGRPAGMGIREDHLPITTNASHFIPHYCR